LDVDALDVFAPLAIGSESGERRGPVAIRRAGSWAEVGIAVTMRERHDA